MSKIGTPHFYVKPMVLRSWESLEQLGLLQMRQDGGKGFRMMFSKVSVATVQNGVKGANVPAEIVRW
jgi:hypothetical protein